MENRKDIFDRIMDCRIFIPIHPLYKKHKEVLLYLLFGGLTFIVSISTYYIFNVSVGLNELVANIISWILAVSFAFITNFIWVFERTVSTMKEFMLQVLKFFMGRVLTLVIEEIILLICVTLLALPSMPVKIVAQIIVIITNYVISKILVFR